MKKIATFHRYIFLIFITSSILYLNSCTKPATSQPITRTGFAFDTIVSITIYDKQKSYVLDECLALCDYYENLFSTTLEGSDIWNINHSNKKLTEVSYDTASLIQSALFYCAETNGLLDLTMLPISQEWHISEQMKLMSDTPDYMYYIPSSDRLCELLRHVNYQNVKIYDESGNEISIIDKLSENVQYRVALLDEQSAIDLGFIAKGYIADALKKYLLSEGVESGIVSLGGNILLIGSKPDNTPFHVGIQQPFGGANEIITTLEETDTSVVSSGCYERYFIYGENEKDRTIYHHIFDTMTGCPVQNDLFGVTIISESSLQGDTLSTYCYILGLDKGLAYIRSLDGVEAVFVTTDYEVISSY